MPLCLSTSMDLGTAQWFCTAAVLDDWTPADGPPLLLASETMVAFCCMAVDMRFTPVVFFADSMSMLTGYLQTAQPLCSIWKPFMPGTMHCSTSHR